MKKISTKVLIPVVLLAVIAVISAVTGLKNANELHTSSKEISDTTVNQLMLLNDISSNFKSIDAITYRMCVSTSKDERDQLMEQVDQYRTDIQTSIDSYEALTQTQEEAAAMETLRENFADYTEVYDRIADFISRGNKDKARQICNTVLAPTSENVDGVLTDGGLYYGPDGECLAKAKALDRRVGCLRSRNLYTIIRGQSAASHLYLCWCSLSLR